MGSAVLITLTNMLRRPLLGFSTSYWTTEPNNDEVVVYTVHIHGEFFNKTIGYKLNVVYNDYQKQYRQFFGDWWTIELSEVVNFVGTTNLVHNIR